MANPQSSSQTARHHVHGGASLASAARASLEAAGEQWTDMRSAIFDAVSHHAKPASAYDIADIVSTARGKRVAPNTVYRILDLFVATNLVRRVESTNAFIANEHPGCLHDCIFLICDNCGQTTHIDDDSAASGVREAARRKGFAPARPVIEVHGRCDDC